MNKIIKLKYETRRAVCCVTTSKHLTSSSSCKEAKCLLMQKPIEKVTVGEARSFNGSLLKEVSPTAGF